MAGQSKLFAGSKHLRAHVLQVSISELRFAFEMASCFFSFMWQICGHVPQTLLLQTDVTCLAAQLSISFFIETFIHAKEKVWFPDRKFIKYIFSCITADNGFMG